MILLKQTTTINIRFNRMRIHACVNMWARKREERTCVVMAKCGPSQPLIVAFDACDCEYKASHHL